MVKFRSLLNEPDNRQIYGIVDSPTGQITVFEPSKEDVQTIMAMQDIIAAFNQDSEDGDNRLDVSGETVLKELIPLLTDLELEEDMSDEEFASIIAHPTVELSNVLALLTDIVTHVYTLMIREYQSDLRLQKMVALSEDISDQAVGEYIERAAKSDEGRKQIREINQLSRDILDKQQSEDKENEIDETAPVLDPNNYTDTISSDLASRFSEMEDQKEDK